MWDMEMSPSDGEPDVEEEVTPVVPTPEEKPEVVTPTPEPKYDIEVSDRVDEMIEGMSLRDEVTQMLMVDFRKWGETTAKATVSILRQKRLTQPDALHATTV